MEFDDYGRHADRPGYVPGLVWLVHGSTKDQDGWYRVDKDGRRVELIALLPRAARR